MPRVWQSEDRQSGAALYAIFITSLPAVPADGCWQSGPKDVPGPIGAVRCLDLYALCSISGRKGGEGERYDKMLQECYKVKCT